MLLPLHLAVNKSAGNPLRPFFKSAGSAFWELPPVGKGVSSGVRERMPGQTGTQRPRVSRWHLGHTAVSVLRLSPSSVRAPSIVLERGCRRARRHRASVIAGQWASPRYCAALLLLLETHNAQPFESRGHITEADRNSTLRKHIVKARIPTCANVHGAYQVVHGTYRVMCCPLIDGRTTVWLDDTTDT